MSKKVLIVVDMQNDFIDGSLGTPEAKAIVPNVAKKIEWWNGDILLTMDTHDDNYLDTREGRYLPVRHCIQGHEGWPLDETVYYNIVDKFAAGFNINISEKDQFAHKDLWETVQSYKEIEIVGLCTDVCVVSNALLLRTFLPETDITVDASCCAGTTPKAHQAALTVMKSCHINIINN